MKKTLLGILFSGIVFVAIANEEPQAQPKMDPVCKEAFQHLHENQSKLEAAIKANDAETVGTIVIADHKYMDDFIEKHPQCKPPHHFK